MVHCEVGQLLRSSCRLWRDWYSYGSDEDDDENDDNNDDNNGDDYDNVTVLLQPKEGPWRTSIEGRFSLG